MRKIIEAQFKFGQVDIAKVDINLSSRDEIPKTLLGLQHIYSNEFLFGKIATILTELTPEEVSVEKGREGMNYWQILVFGVIRLICNWDYDKLQDIADNHGTIRQMLGLSPIMDEEKRFPLQTLKDNISLFTPDILSRINQLVVQEGQKQFGNIEEEIRARCDSFVLKTNAHFPTDINLLLDAMNKVIIFIERACFIAGYSDWRQSRYNIRKTKKLFRKLQKLKHSSSKNPDKIEKRELEIIEAYEAYMDLAERFLKKSEETQNKIKGMDPIITSLLEEVERFRTHGYRQIDQIRRRIMEGETIPHVEKVFSVFEEHTEWISKGKAGVPQELGVRVSILEDQYGFILHHRVMFNETDKEVAVPIIMDAKELHPGLTSCSFDKGYYTPYNREELKKHLETVIMPKMGKLSVKDKELEGSPVFVKGRKQHSAVESAINALENHGLDKCLDKRVAGFERYVALAVLARNFETLGAKIQKRHKLRAERQEKYNETLIRNCRTGTA